jgi:hypothetical protein
MTRPRIAYAFHTGRGNCALGPAADYPDALHAPASADLYAAVIARTDTSVAGRIPVAIVGGMALLADYMERGRIRVEPTTRDRRFERIAESRR